MSEPLRVAVGGGGTGGHIIPALAICRAIRERAPETEFIYIGAPDSMEARLAGAEGIPFASVPISGLRRGAHPSNLLLPGRAIGALYRAVRCLKRNRTVLAIGTGGFSSWPVCAGARLLGIPYVLQEQNAAPGLVTRMMAPRAARIYLGYAEGATRLMVRGGKVLHTGNPTQVESRQYERRDSLAMSAARRTLGLEEDRTTIFVTGGSGGARTLNNTTNAALGRIIELGYNVIWQTGRQWEEPGVSAEHRGRLMMERFLNRQLMTTAYQAADIIVARCGAITLAELAIVGKPAILVPFPYAAGGHQEANGRAVANAGAAKLILDKDFNRAALLSAIAEVDNEGVKMTMATAMRGLARPHAAADIADDILKLANVQ